MHTFLIVLAAVLCLCAIVLILCHISGRNMTPVARTFSSLFIGCCAVMLSVQVMLGYPTEADHYAARYDGDAIQSQLTLSSAARSVASTAIRCARPYCSGVLAMSK